MDCLVCNKPASWCWTDTHGVAQCYTCGTPYRIYHYDENNRRIEKMPECVVSPEWLPVVKAYREQFRRRIPGECSFPGGYELATREEQDLWYEYAKEHAPVMAGNEKEDNQ